MSLRSFFLLCLISLTQAVVMRGQSLDDVRVLIKHRFEDPQQIEWLHTFTGVWQNLHPMVLVLAYDGQSYQGRMHLESGDVWFDLQGYQQDGRAMIQEIDQEGRTSGYLVTDIAEGKMTGQWWSVDFSRSASLSLRSEEVVELRKFEPTLMTISGKVAGDKINLIIQREESDLLSGFCSVSGDQILYRLSGRCEDATCDRMNLELQSPDMRVTELQCHVQRSSSIRLQIRDDDGAALEGFGSLDNKYPIRRLHHAGYIGNADCLYPILSIPSFDQWLQTEVESWYMDMRKHMDSMQLVYGIPGPDERWSIQASAWVDLTLVTSGNISGIMTMFNPELNRYVRAAFIFDTRSGKLQSIGDFGRKAQFEHDLHTDAMELREYVSDDPEFLAWMEAADFKHIALTSDGFVLFTDFDPVYGEQWIKLPYKDYEEKLKRNAFVLDLMNSY